MNQRPAEEALLRNLRSRQSDLTALLDDCSSHWGFEDPIYRFYHQSVKVYQLQDESVRIVHVLESLAPASVETSKPQSFTSVFRDVHALSATMLD